MSIKLCDDMINEILSFVHSTKTFRVNKFCLTQTKRIFTNAAIRLQRWYRGYKLVGYWPYEFCTRRTMMRFYVTKYESAWLQTFPIVAIRKLRIHPTNNKFLVPSEEMKKGFVRNFLNFCDEYRVTLTMLRYYGW